VRTKTPARSSTIFTYTLAILVIFQGVIMLLPIIAVRTAQEVILQDRRRRKHEAELRRS
jgi:uncharacterized membrane protein HdeD (DUF308 family)